jgi:hypothetical protein
MRLTAAFVLVLGTLSGQSPEPVDFFETRVRPVFEEKCYTCHSRTAPKLMAKLDLSTVDGFSRGADGVPIVVPGEPENSRLIRAIEYQSRIKMPPTGKLTNQQIADITAWVKMGAVWPEMTALPNKNSVRVEVEKGPFTAEQRGYWAFQPIRDRPVPKVNHQEWPMNAVDHFLLPKLEEKGLTPAPRVDRGTLLRRATFDLTGLPPTPKEIDDFLSDSSPNAFAKVVDRLLASPRYGEQWGRHWLDVARHADSNGTDVDIKFPYSYRYVDYVIEAFNSDLPFDQFIKEQLAGDLLPSEKPGEVNVRGIVATGFLALGPKPLAERHKKKMIYDIADEQLNATSVAFMGLTVGCARCHDHKFDPIPTRDYYSMASIFASTKSVTKVDTEERADLYLVPLVSKDVYGRYELHQSKIESKSIELESLISQELMAYVSKLQQRLADYMMTAAGFRKPQDLSGSIVETWIEYLKPSDAFRPHLEAWWAAVKRGPAAAQERARSYKEEFESFATQWAQETREWCQKVAEALASSKQPPKKAAFTAGKNRFFAEVLLQKDSPFALPQTVLDSNEKVRVLRAELDSLKKTSPPAPPMACAVSEGSAVEPHVFIRGDVESPGERVPKQFLTILAGENQQPIQGRSGRLELAEWLASANHPLTARVIVNRIWQYHFGYGLVRTANNFGKMGDRPTHPELLDYLAKRFIAGGWSIKAMHRLLMLSSAYQMSSLGNQAHAEIDPENQLLWRFNRRRLDAEEIRDGLLAIEGSLDLAMGAIPQNGTGVENTGEATRGTDLTPFRRRTVYIPLRRANPSTFLTLFNFGDATTPGEGRIRTTIAPQALYLMNSEFMSDRSAGLAKKLLSQQSSDEARIRAAYQLIFGRWPGLQERDSWVHYLDAFRKKASYSGVHLDNPEFSSWQSFCRILMSSNEFIYVN